MYIEIHITIGSTQTPKPTRFLWVSLRSLYHKNHSGLGAGEPGVMFPVYAIAIGYIYLFCLCVVECVSTAKAITF